jgi:PAS domain S-box-containing protein/putative nucleotidyltransferase with HDIG domain
LTYISPCFSQAQEWCIIAKVIHINEPKSFSELAWAYAPGGMFAFDAKTGIILDVNPSAERMMGSTRAELIGMHQSMLHPKDEQARARKTFIKAREKPSLHPGFHLLRKDGLLVPVLGWSSKTVLIDGRMVVIVICRDITDLVEREQMLMAQNWALSAYSLTALALGQMHPTEQVLLQAVCDAITRDSVYKLAWIGVAVEGPEKPIRVLAKGGDKQGYLDGLKLSWSADLPAGLGPTGTCIRLGKPQVMEDSETLAAFLPWRERAKKFDIRSSVSLPIRINGHGKGALIVCAAKPNAFGPVAIEVLQRLAKQIERGVHAVVQEFRLKAEQESTLKMQGQLTDALSAMVAPIILAMEMRDPYTAGHQARVAEIATAIARKMGWPELKVHGLRVAAQVHDIGKLSIPAEILTKPGLLTTGEWTFIHEHPETGYAILKDIPFAWPVAEIVRQHHERLDGSGYPQGLKGDEILPEAKILAVADMVESMTSFRPYRMPLKISVVLRRIEKDAGKLLDAKIVRVCMSLIRKKSLVLHGMNPA